MTSRICANSFRTASRAPSSARRSMRRPSPSAKPSTSPPSDMGATDSAGVPWAGRRFEANASADDDGSAPAGLLDAIVRFRAGEAGQAEVVDALRSARLLVPLVAELGDAGHGEHGHLVDKSQ